jgi:hypothetical protein
MVVRGVKRETVTTDWLRDISFRLCTSIGAKHFSVCDGLPREEFADAHAAWMRSFEAHPLYRDWLDGRGRAAYDRIIAAIGRRPQLLTFALEPTWYSDDGSVSFDARPDECLLEVRLRGRYYGVGYERGDILTYCAVAEWLQVNVGCEVWYGGDSSGVDLVRFDAATRRSYRAHLYSSNGRDYFKSDFLRPATYKPAPCSLCPGGLYAGSQFGVGPNFAAFYCSGCGSGKSVETHDAGATWTERKE